MQSSFTIVATTFAVLASVPFMMADAKSVVARKGSLRGELDGASFKAEVRQAMAEALGCGGKFDDARLANIERALAPMWSASPKNAYGRVERRQLRYLAYRYFMQRFSLMVRGFEPSRPLNNAEWGAADILSQQVPAFVEAAMESEHAAAHGFDLHDAVQLVATLEQLILDSESTLLERVFQRQRRPIHSQLSPQDISMVLQEYMMKWMLDEQIKDEMLPRLLSDARPLEKAFPQWANVASFVNGQIEALDFKRSRAPGSQGVGGLLRPYSFRDAHELVGSITQGFASFWESECASMKDQLVAMDTHGTGRVPLSKFYGTGLDVDWRFGESESYLRELGALDETSTWHGKQVIIPNYIQAASNCIVSTPHYLVCCANDCEALLGELEAGVGEPVGAPEDILRLVGNMTSQTTLDDDDAPHLEGSLTKQLLDIAAAHGGKIPMHGRLFAQWLHYAFPRECPFPHRAGVASALTPSQYGAGYIATNDEMQTHASAANQSEASSGASKEELQWMSQWSAEEELLADYQLHLQAPWERRWTLAVAGAVLLAAAGVSGVVGASRKSGQDVFLLPSHQKAHYI